MADKNYPDGVKQYIENHVLHVFDMHHLPPEIRKRFRSDMRIVVDYLAEQEQYKPTNQAIIQGIIQLLLCHGAVPGQLQERIQAEKDIDTLKSWVVLAAKAATIEEFETNM